MRYTTFIRQHATMQLICEITDNVCYISGTSQAESYEIVATFDVTPAVPCTYHNYMTTLYDNVGLNLTQVYTAITEVLFGTCQ